MTRGRLQAFAAASLLVFVVVLAGCGGGDDESAASREGMTTTVEADTTTVESAATLPAELVGTYEAERKGGDFPPGLWNLAIGARGEFFIVPPGETGFFNSPLTASDGSLVVPPHPDSGCAAAGEYKYTVKGSPPRGSLMLKAVEDSCETRASLLSASWRMTQ